MRRKNTHTRDNSQSVGAGKENNKELPVEEMLWGDLADIKALGLYPPPRLAQAYVLWQKYGKTFSPAEALEKGTLFPELYSPYPY